MTLPNIREHVDLRAYNTLGVSARAERFLTLEDPRQLTLLYEKNYLNPKPWILGGGSNVLFSGTVSRLVIKNEIRFTEVVYESDKEVHIRAGAGNNWHELVSYAVKKGWGGLENLALIPGTVGAAPIQNIGAYGVELSERFLSLEAFDLDTGRISVFGPADCRFAYRESVFKREWKGRYVILAVTLCLNKPPHKIHRSYRSLDEWLRSKKIENPGIEDLFHAVVEIRSSKLPDPAVLGNAGSFFKNPVVDMDILRQVQKRFDEVPFFPASESQVKIPAGWLIEQAGWKGRRFGAVGVYENQALVLVNHGGADGKAILELAHRIQDSVEQVFGIKLVPEVQLIGSGK